MLMRMTSDLHAQVACERLFNDFHCLIDDGHATKALGLFHDGAVFEVRGERYEGIDAIGGFLEAREADTGRRTRHVASNFRFTRESDSSAHATANLTLFTGSGEDGHELKLEAVVDCETTFIRLPTGEWRITTRRHTRFASAH